MAAGDPQRQQLEAARRQAAEACPDVAVDVDRFAAFVQERPEGDITNQQVAADLYLACASLDGDTAALALFEQRYLALVPQLLARLETEHHVVDEVQQQLRERLLVAHGDRRPKLAEYRGRGRLMSWLRVVAVRAALNLRVGRKSDVPGAPGREPNASAIDKLMATPDPELEYLRERYKQQFERAFTAALASLEARERTVLRLHLIDRLNIDQIGHLFDTHRATAARWLTRAREQLFDKTRAALQAELGVSETEFASIARLIRSQLDVSICRILEQETGDS